MFLSMKDIDLKNKRVIVRVDFNVPLEKGNVSNDKKIREAIPTINYLLGQNCKVILMSHLGKPKDELKKGKTMDEVKKNLTLKPVAGRLSELLGKKVGFASDCIGIKIPDERVILLENLRFHPGEEKDDPEFAKQLASCADVYINDAFGTCHRAHSSVHAITTFLPSGAGFLLQKEIEQLRKITGDVQKPFIAIIGGAKEDKIGVIRSLIPKIDRLILGGVLANTFLKYKGVDIAASKYDEESEKVAEELMSRAAEKLMLPVDYIIANKFDKDAETKVAKGNIPAGWMALDIGPETISMFKSALKGAKTVIWAGPIGVFEFDKFANGTREIATFIANSDAISIIGGGDSAAAIEKFGLADKVTHVSTGGGASLEFIELNGNLPGIVALEEASKR